MQKMSKKGEYILLDEPGYGIFDERLYYFTDDFLRLFKADAESGWHEWQKRGLCVDCINSNFRFLFREHSDHYAANGMVLCSDNTERGYGKVFTRFHIPNDVAEKVRRKSSEKIWMNTRLCASCINVIKDYT